jgi:glycosyltransferase involved in cell wall biosynthesis
MKLLFVVSEDWYFRSHRIPIALAALKVGWEVRLGAQISECGAAIGQAGIRLHPLPLRRGSLNPLSDLGYLIRLCRLYRRERPDVVHHVAMKPVLYGSIAARLAGVPCVVNALAGMGYLSSSSRPHVRMIRRAVLFCFRMLFNRPGSILIVQNKDDRAVFERLGVATDRIRLIRGSGVDLNVFSPPPTRSERPTVTAVMASRLLRDKGVIEYVEAARLLRKRNVPVRLALAGAPDGANPDAVPQSVLDAAQAAGELDVLGARSDISALYREADIAVLPSYYREGIPKSLIEAAACGLPIVTTDVAGCRETVGRLKGSPLITPIIANKNGELGENGILVPPKDARTLADAIEFLVRNPDIRSDMGRASREKAEREFGIETVVGQTMAVYNELRLAADSKRG